MASRRRAALSNFLDMYLKHYMATKEADHQGEIVRQRQLELAQQQATNSLLSRIGMDPALAARARSSGVTHVGSFPMDMFVPTDAENVSGVSKDLEGVSSLSSLPTEVGVQRAYEGRPGARVGDPRPIEDLVRERRSKEQALLAALPKREIPGAYDPTTGSTSTRVLPGSFEGNIQTGPTPQQAGRDVTAKFRAGEGSPEYNLTKVQNENEMVRGTSAAKAAAAGATTSANTNAQQTAYNRPEFQDARVAEATRIAQAHAKATGTTTTEGERKGAGQTVSLTQSHLNLLQMEKGGTRLQTLATNVVGSPLWSKVNAGLNAAGGFGLDPKSLVYAQALQDFITTFGYMTSGVAINKEEIPRFISVVGAQSDDPPQVVAAKQASRMRILQAAQVVSGRSGYEGGQILAGLFKNGTLDPALIPTLEFTNEQFQKGFMDNYQVPKVR